MFNLLKAGFLLFLLNYSIAEEHQKENSIEETDDNLIYHSPEVDRSRFYFIEDFDNVEKSNAKWIRSEAKKDDTAEEIAKYDGVWEFSAPDRIVWKNDLGLVLRSKAKHSAISAKLDKKFVFNEKPIVIQYEVTMQNIQDCGGSYIKLLSDVSGNLDLKQFNDKTPYTIMFGPDKCGNDIKLHFIFRHINPINGSISEKHCRKPKERMEEPFKDKLPHLYQLIIYPNNTFQISIDHRVVNHGSLLTDFSPPVNPPREIDDPQDKKPENWDEREKIPDPDAVKPDDWNEDAPAQIPDPSAVRPSGWLEDESEMVPDPNAEKPEDWDTDIDGEWEASLIDNPICEKAAGCGKWKAPLIDNPEYKGKWRAPLIDNPNYQGKWLPKKISNPEYFEDLHPFRMTAIAAVGIEIWSMSSDILFDNIVITDEVDVANDYAEKTFDLKSKYISKESESVFSKLISFTNENSWIWGIYIVVIGTPLSFVFYTLCCSKKERSNTSSEDSKKTDEVLPDDEDDGKRQTLQNPTTKTALDVKHIDSVNEEDKDDENLEDNFENIHKPKENQTTSLENGSRRRKPRKE